MTRETVAGETLQARAMSRIDGPLTVLLGTGQLTSKIRNTRVNHTDFTATCGLNPL